MATSGDHPDDPLDPATVGVSDLDETLLDQFESWVGSHRSELSRFGAVSFLRGPEDRDNRSAQLIVEGSQDVLHLALWESGTVELGLHVGDEVRLDFSWLPEEPAG